MTKKRWLRDWIVRWLDVPDLSLVEADHEVLWNRQNRIHDRLNTTIKMLEFSIGGTAKHNDLKLRFQQELTRAAEGQTDEL